MRGKRESLRIRAMSRGNGFFRNSALVNLSNSQAAITGLALQVDRDLEDPVFVRTDRRYLLALAALARGDRQQAENYFSKVLDINNGYEPNSRGFSGQFGNPADDPLSGEKFLFKTTHPKFNFEEAYRIYKKVRKNRKATSQYA